MSSTTIPEKHSVWDFDEEFEHVVRAFAAEGLEADAAYKGTGKRNPDGSMAIEETLTLTFYTGEDGRQKASPSPELGRFIEDLIKRSGWKLRLKRVLGHRPVVGPRKR